MRLPKTSFWMLACLGLLTACEREAPVGYEASDTAETDQDTRAKESWNERTFTVSLQVPTPSHHVDIQEVWQVGDEIWIWARVQRQEGMAAQVITESVDSITLKAPSGAVRYFVSGITWSWGELPEGYQRVTDENAFQPAAQGGTQIFPPRE